MQAALLENLMDEFCRSLPRWRNVVSSRLQTRDWAAIAAVSHQLCETALTYGILELSEAAGLCRDGTREGGDAVAIEKLVSRMLVEMDLVTAGSRQ